MHLRFDPVIDLAGDETPLAGDFLAWQIAAAGELGYLAYVTLQVSSQLLQVHDSIFHDNFLISNRRRDNPCSIDSSENPLQSSYQARIAFRPCSGDTNLFL